MDDKTDVYYISFYISKGKIVTTFTFSLDSISVFFI